ncbi:tryptophanase [Streptomyces sp. CA-100214]
MEPYRIKAVEPIPTTTREERETALRRVGYNLFGLRAEEVTIDLLTDSGTGALSAAQWAAGVAGDESYAGSRSFHRFREVVSELTSYPHVLPVHQGRAAERVLFSALLAPGRITLSNTHFDTTRANVELSGCQARDLPCPRARNLHSPEPFKGDIDLEGLAGQLSGPDASRIALVIMTLTNNGEGGQPVSMDNLTRAAALCREHGVPFFLDAARFAENAYLVTQYEAGYGSHSPTDVARRAFRLADGCLMSAKKDGIVHIGGFLGLRDEALARRCELTLIATEGFPTYGGLAGRDLEMIAQGLTEALDPRYLRSRAEAAAHLAGLCRGAGVHLVEPPACTRSTSTRVTSSRTSPRIASPATHLPARCTWRVVSVRWSSAPSTSAGRTATGTRSPPPRTSCCDSRFPAGRTPEATWTTSDGHWRRW